MQTLFFRGARQLLTLRGPNEVRRGKALADLGIIADGSILVRDGRIISVGTTRRLENLKEARNAVEVPVHGKVVLPGFVDAGMTLSLDRASEGRRPRRAIEFQDYSLSLMRACQNHGSMTVKVHASADNGNLASDLRILSKLHKVSNQHARMLRAWRVPSSALASPDIAATLDTLRKRHLVNSLSVTTQDSGESGSPAAFEQLQSCGLPCDLLWPGGALNSLAHAIKKLRPGVVYASAPLTNPEAHLLAQIPAITMLPSGRQLLEGNGAPAATRALIENGGAIALSSGYYTSNAPTFNMQMAIALAVVRLGLSPEEAICAATVNAAMAIGQSHIVGTLEVGKQAEIVVLNIPDLRELPNQFGINHAAMVLSANKFVLNRTRWNPPVETLPGRVRPKPL